MSLVPLPWCTSQSTIITRSSPWASSAWRAATAMLLNRQNPIARSDSAWWPGRPVDAEAGRRRRRPAGGRPAPRPLRAACSAASNEPAEIDRVGVDLRATRRRGALDQLDVALAGARPQTARGRRPASCTRSKPSSSPRRELPLDRHDPRRLLGMRPGVVLQRGRMLQKHGRGGHRRVPYLHVSASQTEVAVVGAGAAGLYTALERRPAGRTRHARLRDPAGRLLQLLGSGRPGRGAVRRRQSRAPPRRHARGRPRLGAGIGGPGPLRGGAGARSRTWPRSGVSFDADRDGRLALGLEGGHSVRRIVHAGGRRHRPAADPPAVGAGGRGPADRGARGPPRDRILTRGRAGASAIELDGGDPVDARADRAGDRRRGGAVGADDEPARCDRRRAAARLRRGRRRSPTSS